MDTSKNSFTSRFLDYSDPADAAKVLESLGGEELLKSRFPKVYSAFLRTREAHAKAKDAVKSAGNEQPYEPKPGIQANPVALIPKNNAPSAGKVEEKLSGLINGRSWLQSNEIMISGMVNAYMQNVTSGGMLKTFSQRVRGVGELDVTLERDVEDVQGFSQKVIQNYIGYTAFQANGLMATAESTSDRYILDGSCPVTLMRLDDPRSKINNNPIIMLYARTPDQGETADYSYENNRLLTDPPHAVKTIFPVKGQIVFSKDYTPKCFSTVSTSAKPMLRYRGEGVVEHDDSYEEMAKLFVVSEDNPQIMNFSLDENWGRNLDISAYTSEHKGVLGLEFSFYIETVFHDAESGKDFDADIPFSIFSEKNGTVFYESHEDTNLALPEVKIKWGCFAKDSLIRMADGAECPACDVKIGDMMMSSDGEAVKVRGVVSGVDASIFCIRTKKGRTLKVTGTHPVATKRGVLPADKIICGDMLECENGETDEVLFVYDLDYNDTVYNFDMEKDVMLIANGIKTGDFKLQNELKYKCAGTESINPEFLRTAEEFDELFDYLDSLKG